MFHAATATTTKQRLTDMNLLKNGRMIQIMKYNKKNFNQKLL